MMARPPLTPKPFPSLIASLLALDFALAALAWRRWEAFGDFLFFQAGLLALILFPLLALYMLCRRQLDAPLPRRGLALLILGALLLSLALDLSSRELVVELLGVIHRRFRQPGWHWLGLILAAGLFPPLIWRALSRTWRSRDFPDLAVGGIFLLILALHFLPFGFDSIAHWESWTYRAFLEGQSSWNVDYELTTRFWVALPHLLATLISPESFFGFHLVQLLMLYAKLVLLYGILRKLKISRAGAFLISMLFLVYPVNSDLLSLRSLPNQFSALALLAAGYLALDYLQRPGRLGMLGMWLALAFNVASTETAYALILAAPLVWLLDRGRSRESKLNLSALWVAVPACGVAHMLLLSALKLKFYNSYVLERAGASLQLSLEQISPVLRRLLDVYWHTFVDSWLQALAALGAGDWLLASLLLISLAAAMGLGLLRGCRGSLALSPRRSLRLVMAGLLFIPPAVGVLIWLEGYQGDLWRPYFYVPIGAALAVYGSLTWLTTPIKGAELRGGIILAACLALMLPGFARLYAQQQSLVQRADAKAAMLRDLMTLVPGFAPDAHWLLLSDMTSEQLHSSPIAELAYSKDLDNSILFTLYGSQASVKSVFCLSRADCNAYGDEDTLFTAPELLPRTVIIAIKPDLSLQLIKEPAARYGVESVVAYNVGRLIDADRPPPPRAITMLGAPPRD